MHIFASRISKSNRISNSSKQDIMMNKTAVIAMAALISSSAALAKDIKMIAIKTSPVVKTVEKYIGMKILWSADGSVPEYLMPVGGVLRR